MQRVIRWLCLYCALAFLAGCSAPDVITDERRYFETSVRHHASLKHQTIEYQGDRLHFVGAGDIKKPALIIIHGTPSEWWQFARLMLNKALLAEFYVVVIDRPGWGQSTLAGDRKTATFAQQSALIGRLVEQLRDASDNQPVIIMGHSLGASLAPRIALDFPEKVDGLLLLAGTLDPALASPRWFNYAATLWVVNVLLSEDMRKANEEIFELKNNLISTGEQWASLGIKTIVVQGMSDQLVYPANADFADKLLDSNNAQVIRLEKTGHFFPMTEQQKVIDWSLALLQRIKSP